ncbi:hypothetical protein HA402_004545 [Bradysia odoriphaga]|nr:hypothetical protein HA402_004545 [Bradysia odoriphaga]
MSFGTFHIVHIAFSSPVNSEASNVPIPKLKLNKIPGEIPNIPAEKKVNVKDLKKYTKVELDELLERLLSNKARLNSLPDRGKRIQDFHDSIVEEIAKLEEIDVPSELFSDLNIATKSAPKLTNMEWNGKYNPNHVDATLDSDDDDKTDPIALLAQSRLDKKKVKVLQPEPQLITSADLDEIKSFSRGVPVADSVNSSNNSDLESHALHMCEVESHKQNRPKFLPHKTTKSDCHSLDVEKSRRQGKHWEVTAATPPIIRNSGAQVLSLQESIAIQRQQNEHLKEVEREHAEERLAAKNQLAAKIMSVPQLSERNMNLFFTYRDVVDDKDGSDDDDPADVDSDDQVHDDEGYVGGGVSVVQYDD